MSAAIHLRLYGCEQLITATNEPTRSASLLLLRYPYDNFGILKYFKTSH